MVRRVFSLGDRTVSGVMTPRPDIVWIDLTKPAEDATMLMIDSGHSRFPAAEGSLDEIAGVIELRDVAARSLRGQDIDLRTLVRPPLMLPESTPALAVLERLRSEQRQLAFVLDEYGGVEGIVTLADLAESVMGRSDPDALVTRPDGSMLVDGMLRFEDLAHRLDLTSIPPGDYSTVAGFVIATLGRLPRVSDSFEAGRYRFEVMDMDGHRVDRVLVTETRSRPEVSPDA